MSKPHVIVYSRPGCHLCEEAKAAILGAGCSDHFTFEEVNIDSSEALLEKYRYDIPVITIDGAETFIHRLSAADFRRKIMDSHKKAQKSQK